LPFVQLLIGNRDIVLDDVLRLQLIDTSFGESSDLPDYFRPLA
jgi:hypothetical protein